MSFKSRLRWIVTLANPTQEAAVRHLEYKQPVNVIPILKSRPGAAASLPSQFPESANLRDSSASPVAPPTCPPRQSSTPSTNSSRPSGDPLAREPPEAAEVTPAGPAPRPPSASLPPRPPS